MIGLAPFVVIYDASVLYPVRLADLLMRVALKGFVHARWTDEIHEEWIRNLIEDRGIERAVLERRRDQMNNAIRDSLVEGYEVHLPTVQALKLSDPDDAHVIAAAIHAKAQAIVTANIKHFPRRVLEPFELLAETPDDFITGLLAINQPALLEVLREQRGNLKKPPLDKREFLTGLADSGLKNTVRAIEADFMSEARQGPRG